MAFCSRPVRLCFFFLQDVPRGRGTSFVRLISLSSRVFAYDDRILLGTRGCKVQKILTHFSRIYFPILIQTELNKHFRKVTIKPIRIRNLRQSIKKKIKKERRGN